MSDSGKPSTQEDEYFAKEQAEKLRKLALERHRKLEAAEREAQKQAHYMRCPKCGDELHTIHFREIDVDRCFNCGGTWLDQGELEKVVAKEGGAVTEAILNWFRA